MMKGNITINTQRNPPTVNTPFPTLIDTHCHLDYIGAGLHGHEPTTDLATVVQRATENGVRWLINPGVEPAAWQRVLNVAEQFPTVFAALAIHPCDVDSTLTQPNWLADLTALLKHPKVVAIGETGLDYYHQPAEACDLQRDCFAKTLTLASQQALPFIIHCRHAEADVAKIIAASPPLPKKGVMHCFGGDADFALAMVERGFYISFAGNVTFKKAEALRAAAKATPLDYLLVETDSPFLSPMPERGLPNEPYRTRFVAECLATVKGISVEKLAQITTENAIRLFNLPITGQKEQPTHA